MKRLLFAAALFLLPALGSAAGPGSYLSTLTGGEQVNLNLNGVNYYTSTAEISTYGNPVNYNGITAPVLGGTGVSPQQAQSIRQCIAEVQAQVQNCTMAGFGDSVLYGENSSTTITSQRITYFLAKDLSSIPGVYANDASVCGFGTSAINRLTADPRFTTITGMSNSNTIGYGGGLAAFANSSASLVYNPGIAAGASPGFVWDTVKVIFYGGSGNGSVTATGGTAQTAALSPTGFTTITASASSAASTNTVTMAMPTGTSAYVECIEPYLSTQDSINIIDEGNPGASLPTLISGGSYGYQALFPILAPQVTFSLLAKNDWYYQTPLATFNSSLAQLAAVAQATGTFVVGADMPDNTQSNAIQLSYVNALQTFATANNEPYVDDWTRWGTANNYTYLNANGWLSAVVPAHPSPFGYSDIAWSFAQAMLGE